MQTPHDRTAALLMEQLIDTGPDGMAAAFTAMLNLAMRIECWRHVGAQADERSPERSGYANGKKAKKIDTPAGTLTVEVPKSRGGDAPFYPQALERGRRSSRAVMLAIAQMYIQGVSTRDVEKVMAEFGLESLSSAQVSRAAALMDEELEAWRTRQLDAFPYLFLPPACSWGPLREGPHRRCGPRRGHPVGDRRRRGRQAQRARPLRRPFRGRGPLARLSRQPRGPRATRRAVHHQRRPHRPPRSASGLARRAVFPGAVWQRCQFHRARNAIHHAPTVGTRKAIGRQLRAVWNATDRVSAEAELARIVKEYAHSAPKLATWLERAVPEG